MSTNPKTHGCIEQNGVNPTDGTASACHPPLSPELVACEVALARLVPRADRLHRDQVLFAAGRAAALTGRTSRWKTWILTTWASGATFATLLLGLMTLEMRNQLALIRQRPHPSSFVGAEGTSERQSDPIAATPSTDAPLGVPSAGSFSTAEASRESQAADSTIPSAATDSASFVSARSQSSLWDDSLNEPLVVGWPTLRTWRRGWHVADLPGRTPLVVVEHDRPPTTHKLPGEIHPRQEPVLRYYELRRKWMEEQSVGQDVYRPGASS